MLNFMVHFDQIVDYNGSILDYHRKMFVPGAENEAAAISMVEKYLRSRLQSRAKSGPIPEFSSRYHNFCAKESVPRPRKVVSHSGWNAYEREGRRMRAPPPCCRRFVHLPKAR